MDHSQAIVEFVLNRAVQAGGAFAPDRNPRAEYASCPGGMPNNRSDQGQWTAKVLFRRAERRSEVLTFGQHTGNNLAWSRRCSAAWDNISRQPFSAAVSECSAYLHVGTRYLPFELSAQVRCLSNTTEPAANPDRMRTRSSAIRNSFGIRGAWMGATGNRPGV